MEIGTKEEKDGTKGVQALGSQCVCMKQSRHWLSQGPAQGQPATEGSHREFRAEIQARDCHGLRGLNLEMWGLTKITHQRVPVRA